MRALNFSPGPATLPEPVLKKIQEDITNYKHSKFWIAEISHRSKIFTELLAECNKKLRRILEIPEDYETFFCQGGATLQYALIPLNFLSKGEKAAYAISGHWSRRAYNLAGEKKNLITINCGDFFSIKNFAVPDNIVYLLLCENETIHGCQYETLPDFHSIISDQTSNILSKKIDFKNQAVIFASTQKNLGISGLTLIIIRKDFLELSKKNEDKMSPVLNYYHLCKANSMINTPNTFAIYTANLVLDWIIEKGGVDFFEKERSKKSTLLYDAIDSSGIYENLVKKKNRSAMNITFSCKNKELNPLFLEQAEKQNLLFLKGHRSLGGMRASLYNAMSLVGVKSLINFMKKFENKHQYYFGRH